MSDRLGEVRARYGDADLQQPRIAFAYGLALGGVIERERIEGIDEQAHRAAVHEVLVDITRADRRAHADRPGAREGDHAGGPMPVWGGLSSEPVYTGAYSR